MTTFIFDVLKDLETKKVNLSELTFILPSKRAGLFLKRQIPNIIKQTIFSPIIISIEEFVENLSQLKSVTNTELLFHFYDAYNALTKKESRDSFEVFSKWAQILLQDFNEIDRYLIPQEAIFNYLGDIQELKHWSLEENPTDFVKNYVYFWKKLYDYYDHFTKILLEKKIGYQGLIYRKATENLENYIQNHQGKQHVFIGFNALNTAEQNIIQNLLKNKLAKIYWDIDSVFINNSKHDAGLFTRQYKNNWDYYKQNSFNWITHNYSKQKKISVFGIPKNIGQAKCIGSLLKSITKTNKSLESTAVILSDENLLIPVLNSIPASVEALNITMGFPLKSIPLTSLFELFFKIHKTTTSSFYFKDVINIVSHQFIRPLFIVDGFDYSVKIVEYIDVNNIVYLTTDRLKQLAERSTDIVDLLFTVYNKSVGVILKNSSQLIIYIKRELDNNKDYNVLSLEYLYRFNELFNVLNRLNSDYEHINDISTLHGIYKELLSTETLDFQGEPLKGLQVMGMLESRVLDFDTVIISSVNEGILPSGKTNNSFIPFDVKLQHNLPTHKEKDAVYMYHFYRLLQRAKNVYVLYNTEANVITGGEKSRFITQLELENIHDINHQTIAPEVPVIFPSENSIHKTDDLLRSIKDIAKKGFSPSSLSSYIRNPISFYYQKVLKVNAYNNVEETVAANTLGTVVHNTLEDLYKPCIGKFLTQQNIEEFRTQILAKIQFHFKKEYKEGDITKGKNLIIFEIAKRYVTNFITQEEKNLKAGNKIKIIAIEANETVIVDIPGLDFSVKLTGKVDRIDEFNGLLRIIDYKTGRVEQNKVELVNWEDLTTDYTRYSKSFQVLTYAYILMLSKKVTFPIEAGIISFKNLNAGFLKFSKKDKSGGGAKKDSLITEETLDYFAKELKTLILEICDINTPFTEKEV